MQCEQKIKDLKILSKPRLETKLVWNKLNGSDFIMIQFKVVKMVQFNLGIFLGG
jgi:hypothetical protein